MVTGARPLPAAAALWVVVVGVALAQAQLSPDYYARGSCEADVTGIVRDVVESEYRENPRIAAGLLRVHFHDCFVGGCDASVLLSGSNSEQGAPPNKDSLQERAFIVVDDIKAQLESACPGVVSCADILALAAMVSIQLAGGPYWTVMLGRKDSLYADLDATRKLPSPTDGLDVLKRKFAQHGLDDTDFIALQGAHTIGRALCQSSRLNFGGTGQPDPNLDPADLTVLQNHCSPSENELRLFLDQGTPDRFDNSYYTNLINNQGLLQSDQVLYTQLTDAMIVREFAASQDAFFDSFTRAMVRMGNILPPTGMLEIRQVCSAQNPN